MLHQALDTLTKQLVLRSRYDNFIGGQWVAPVEGQYFTNLTPISGKPLCDVARSQAADVEMALDAAHKAKDAWGRTSPTDRANMLLKIADRMEERLEVLALAETLDNGKPIRETRAADVPLAIDHFRYFAGCIRAQEGTIAEIDHTTYAYHFHEPLGVVGQIIPWNFPLLMAAWKIAPALAAGNCVVLKPAEQTPMGILVLMDIIGDILPPGVLNVVNGFGLEAGKPLATSKRIAKVAFTGETSTGRLIMQYAAENIIPVTLELGGKSPNIFFADVLADDDDYLDKALEGFAMFALNQGEVCTCPSRVLVQKSIYDRFMERAVARVGKVKQGHPLDPNTMIGAQASQEQLDKILSYIDIGRAEGANVLIGGERAHLGGELEGGYYVTPTVLEGHNKMRVFQEEIFGPVVSVTTFETEEEALTLANDTSFGLGAGLWTRDGNRAFRMGRGIQAGRVWTNCYHLYPAHAAFGGYKQSGIGRETHRMMLDHYQQTKNLLVSYSPKALGFF
ncbi:aldehyde dehydrogenase family protein [Azospirillum sp. RWY-5-1]|uniref:Aldehyde dehydrogenase family protein n=1 Tax=Azospirillum oleiclasticum TaxID=2735135 RepID=A0ABX2T804_9PROT|nr:aldehyde dehydrogenase [Azospirillum oleiclasticum]NYZ12755.1 aldehyde dehydrogenase family protein [Azospirillum oleiclasticum]NYZ19915.1 aldehyde dehydrogenase family protein [Azospirillum oleiclasticum]